MTADSHSIDHALKEGARQLAAAIDADARVDAELLLAHALNVSRVYIKTWPEREVPRDAWARYIALLAQRAVGEPVAYLVGTREFWSLSLRVTRDTLIPRPETELLVEHALRRTTQGQATRVLDLGTGTGAIALALARERAQSRLVAVDVSAAAVQIARDNAQRLNIANVEFRCGVWFAPCADERFDVIVSNPPYVAADDVHLQRGDVRFEPLAALTPGADALAALRQIIDRAPLHLKSGGWLLVEHGYDQGVAVKALFAARGYKNIEGYRDLAGNERVVAGQY